MTSNSELGSTSVGFIGVGCHKAEEIEFLSSFRGRKMKVVERIGKVSEKVDV